MPVKTLPSKPNLEWLKRQARQLLRQHAAGDPRACQRIREFYPRLANASDDQIRTARLSRSDGLFIIAREYGFASWPRLRDHVLSAAGEGKAPYQLDTIADPEFRAAVASMEDGDLASLRQMLDANPSLATSRAHFDGVNYFRDPSLLAFVAENPVRNDCLPPNILAVAQLLLDHGAGKNQADLDETLQLVASGRVPREAGVQEELIRLLCSRGASPDTAVIAAVANGEFDAAETLLRRGARLTLPLAAAFGDTDSVIELLNKSDDGQRHLALALAAQHGRTEPLEALLRAGVDPNRYNPIGADAHSTPLHQAAWNGHADAVRILLEHGANPQLTDILWEGTALDWAQRAQQNSVIALLQERES